MVAVTRATGLLIRIATVGTLAVALAACGTRVAIDSRLGVSASERVAGEDDAIAKGGGRAHVGRPYTIAGRTYVPRHDADYSAEGLASWYGARFHGRKTANGEVFDRFALSAAHTTMPLPSYARVTNLENDRSIIVRVNDRGPFHGNRIIDVSRAVADTLAFRGAGVARVRVDYVGPASTQGSDDEILMATLRTDGRLAEMPIEGATSIQVASAGGAPQVDRIPLAAADRPVAPTLAFASAPPTMALPVPPARPNVLASAQPTAVNASLPGATPAATLDRSAEAAQLVGIFFAAPDQPAPGFVRAGPFADVAAQAGTSLRR
ncbi:septal ring lytic transglycosylase RlpA family protein [Salinarimonas rosea]|uniref:septal ring lytic transglycosylase RlpA family protein n=1 Tax=Salinarimonas rosea TaxID=552063 RepID=UPI000694641C|nr:septal ring lytic transglycosylase RlpA family protein [Salinarimonas rosea]